MKRLFSSPELIPAGEILDPLYRGVPGASVANILLGAIVVYAMAKNFHNYDPSLWLALLAVAILARVLTWLRYRRDPGACSVASWLRKFTLYTLGIGCSWGLANILLFSQTDFSNQVFLAFVTAGITAGALYSLSFHLPAYFAFQIPILLPLIVQFALLNSGNGWGFAVMTLLFGAYTALGVVRMHMSWRENVARKIESDRREQLLLRMERLAVVGAWRENIEYKEFECTAQWRRILAIDESAPAHLEQLFAHCAEGDRAALQAALDACRQAGSVADLALRLTGLAGGVKSARVHAERIATERGFEVTGILHDTSAQTAGERAKNEFISVVSHELRTPLTAIIGALGMLESSLAKAANATVNTNMLSIASRNSARLLQIVNDLLDIAKIESGTLTLECRPQALQPLIERVIADNTPYANAHNVTLRASAIDAVTVDVDGQRVLQILTNLVSNAVKFSPAGQSVEIGTLVSAHHVRIRVSDRGPGISEEFRARIFSRFAQADSSDTRKMGGTGLGLAISKQLAEMMHGALAFETTAGEGTTFFCTLPLVRN